ncbi:hypothetical protein E2C01_045398 [Portunus trituberculatus]|uniref:Uncharacterized protein n=1 Tax=Portunus trituberculatus TaxID=210409 RepID=A0A5B7FUW3_PORTR|nr:hypothetical protein [Portunus trituberculatus]
MDHRVHTWQFEFKLGRTLAAARQTTRLTGDVRPLSKLIRTPFCLCYPLLAWGTNSGNLRPAWLLPAQHLVPMQHVIILLHYLMGLHVDSKAVFILEQPVAYHALMALGAFGFEVLITLMSLLKDMVAVGTCAVLNGKRISCWIQL